MVRTSLHNSLQPFLLTLRKVLHTKRFDSFIEFGGSTLEAFAPLTHTCDPCELCAVGRNVAVAIIFGLSNAPPETLCSGFIVLRYCVRNYTVLGERLCHTKKTAAPGATSSRR